ncbi:MAG: site-2 protease family protein [Paracoccaceae bacterium]
MFQDTNPIAEFRGPWGVPIQIGASLFLIPMVFVDLFSGDGASLMRDLIFVAVLIGSIYLHELGHAWASLIQGVPVRRIMLFGGGGFCERTRSATRYEQELIVAMGPIVNLVLWAVAGLIANVVTDPEIWWVFATISSVNLFLAVMNLVPVQPLDGGKLFELFLHRVLPPDAAIRVAGGVGLFLSILWIPVMLMSFAVLGLMLFFIPSPRLHWQMLRYRQA